MSTLRARTWIMFSEYKRIGVVEITMGAPPGHDVCDGPPDSGIEVRCVIDEPDHADERQLKYLAFERLMREVDKEAGDALDRYRQLVREVYSFPWTRVFHEGMRIRSRDGSFEGVVVDVMNFSADDVPQYQLLVDGTGDPALEGGGIMSPWNAIPVDDQEAPTS